MSVHLFAIFYDAAFNFSGDFVVTIMRGSYNCIIRKSCWIMNSLFTMDFTALNSSVSMFFIWRREKEFNWIKFKFERTTTIHLIVEKKSTELPYDGC